MTLGLFKITEVRTYNNTTTRETTKTVVFEPVSGYDTEPIKRILPASVADQLTFGDVVRLRIEKIE